MLTQMQFIDPFMIKNLVIVFILIIVGKYLFEHFHQKEKATESAELKRLQFDEDFKNLKHEVRDAGTKEDLISLEAEFDKFEWYYINFFKSEDVKDRKEKIYSIWYTRMTEFSK